MPQPGTATRLLPEAADTPPPPAPHVPTRTSRSHLTHSSPGQQVRLCRGGEVATWRATIRLACCAAGLRIRTGLANADDRIAWTHHVDHAVTKAERLSAMHDESASSPRPLASLTPEDIVTVQSRAGHAHSLVSGWLTGHTGSAAAGSLVGDLFPSIDPPSWRLSCQSPLPSRTPKSRRLTRSPPSSLPALPCRGRVARPLDPHPHCRSNPANSQVSQRSQSHPGGLRH